jgi:hypothetical protein
MGTYGKSNYRTNSYLLEFYRENWLIFPWNFGLGFRSKEFANQIVLWL